MPTEPLAPDEINDRLTGLEDWQLVGGKLHRDLEFDDFRHAFAFMAGVALEAEHLNHHPDWTNSWNKVSIDIVSHHAGGITETCLKLAAAIDAHAG
ncbi:MAG TPA: 4a-hydroxytetrahydrobiopterin dehydratase [Acidimicrobiales bacterium]|nr:4a-hydroxytetrahydrobiopterin dehydratase [Acidimicrobiales bacterium]